MKRIFLVVILGFMAVSASAQYVDVRLGRVWSEDGKLTDQQALALFSDVDGSDMSHDYARFRRGYKTGAGLMIGGAAGYVGGSLLGASGLLMTITGGFSSSASLANAGVASLITSGFLICGGIGCFIAGIPVLCVNNFRMKSLAEAYNDSSSRSVELSFGPTASGVGLALNF